MVLASPLVIFAAAVMYLVEFFADKIPGVDTGWDTVHTFIRIPAGALLAAGAVGSVNPAVAVAAALLGGGMANPVPCHQSRHQRPHQHFTGTIHQLDGIRHRRCDGLGGIWAALHHPWLFLVLLLAFVLLAIWLLPKLWQGIRRYSALSGDCLASSSPPGMTSAPAPFPVTSIIRKDHAPLISGHVGFGQVILVRKALPVRLSPHLL